MRNGIPYYVMDRYSYSDAYRIASIPLRHGGYLDDRDVDLPDQAASSLPRRSPTSPQPSCSPARTSAGDVQYVLMWTATAELDRRPTRQRKNSQVSDLPHIRCIEVDQAPQSACSSACLYNNGYGGATSMYVDDTRSSCARNLDTCLAF